MNTFRLPLRAIVAPLALFYLVSCKEKEENEPMPPGPEPDTVNVSAAEEAYPGMDCIWQDGMLNGEPIRYGVINNEAIFDRDIILTPEQLAAIESPGGRTSGAATSDKIKRWRDFTIPYTIRSSVSSVLRKRIMDAIAHWEARTPLRFKLRTNEADYVTFRNSGGNDSNIGRLGIGEQFIRLNPSGSNTGTVIHEIGHTVGLFHEHNRSDRNNYVTFHSQNVDINDAGQFKRYKEDGELGFDFGEFDFGSVMLYSSNAFSANGSPSLTRKDGSTFTAQRERLSTGDAKTVISMYANLYIMWRGNLYAVCVKDGSYAMIRDGWDGFNAETMAEDNGYLWVISGETLYRVNRLNGKRKSFGSGWNGAIGVTGIVEGDTRWAIQGKDLYAINKDGVRKDVDNFDWSNSKAIFAHKDFLFIVDGDGTLWKLDMNTSKWHNIGEGWGNTKVMAVTRASSNDLYIIEGSILWRVDMGNGSYKKIGPSHWAGAEGMVGVQGELYIVADGTLWKVDENGNRQSLGGGWSGTQSMGIIRNGSIL